MTRETLVRIVVVTLVALILGSASLIITRNGSRAVGEAPSGFLH